MSILHKLIITLLSVGLLVAGFQLYSVASERNALREKLRSKDLALAAETGRVKALREQGRLQAEERDLKYAEDIKAVVATYHKELENANTLNQETIRRLRSDLANSVREQALRRRTVTSENVQTQSTKNDSNSASIGLSENGCADAISQAEEYIKTLETAGAMCAADFNACRLYVEQENQRIGVEE